MARITSIISPPSLASLWLLNNPGYVTPVPNGAGFGMDGTFGLTTDTTVYLVNTLSTSVGSRTQVEERTYTCSLNYARQASGPKVVLPIISGNYEGSGLNQWTTANMTYGGQVAPSPGFVGQNVRFRGNRGQQLFWHWANESNLIVPPDDLDNRDAIQAGDDWENYANEPQKQVWANCSGLFASDEAMEMYSSIAYITFWQCLFGYMLQYGKGGGVGNEHACGGIVGDTPRYVSILRSMFSHGNYRMPFHSRGTTVTASNLLAYNSGSNNDGYNYNEWLTIGRNTKSQYGVSGWVDEPSFHNIEHCLFVAGPNTRWRDWAIGINMDGKGNLVNGSRLWAEGNRVHGFTHTNTASQSGIILDQQPSAPSGFYSGSRILSAYPTGYRPYTFGQNNQEMSVFAALMRDTVGSRPKDRSVGFDGDLAAQPYRRINSLGSYGFIPNSPLDVGPRPTRAVNTVDPYSYAQMDGDPLISVAAGRDAIQPSGLTWLAEWLQRWHFRRAWY